MDVGPCDAAIPRYYYDKNSNKCKLFDFGGCDGNANNFESLKECELKCKKKFKKCLNSFSYNPVCGTNGKTYPNQCEAEYAGIGVACNGKCPCTGLIHIYI